MYLTRVRQNVYQIGQQLCKGQPKNAEGWFHRSVAFEDVDDDVEALLLGSNDPLKNWPEYHGSHGHWSCGVTRYPMYRHEWRKAWVSPRWNVSERNLRRQVSNRGSPAQRADATHCATADRRLRMLRVFELTSTKTCVCGLRRTFRDVGKFGYIII